ncbi:NAD-dependent epimerase [Spirochaetia bacterium]|nr:NAD-dependent epimerase [Spirochaetia bacterium]
MKLLVTGTAGFIGYHLTHRLAQEGYDIVGIDNINDYYDVELKHGRLADLGFAGWGEAPIVSTKYPNVRFIQMDITDALRIKTLFVAERFDMVVHLAAQAGVRYSLKNPDAYITSNIQGFLNILEAARCYPVQRLLYASSSSVYGDSSEQPFSEDQSCDKPVSLYAASKKANELMAYAYSHLYGIPATGMRFFTAYGPWGRPDMAPFLFTKAILAGEPIRVFNNGNMQRDFTYIDDIVEGIVRLLDHAPEKIYNIGNGKPLQLMDFIHTVESELGIGAQINMEPMQSGDVSATWADCRLLERDTGYHPDTTIEHGIKQFIAWYKNFYRE